jgi:hypothetical protein
MFDRPVKVECKHGEVLGKLEANSKQHMELLRKHGDILEKLVDISAKNSLNLEHHIKRTDILQARQTKIITLITLTLGMALAYFGPTVLRFVGLLI